MFEFGVVCDKCDRCKTQDGRILAGKVVALGPVSWERATTIATVHNSAHDHDAKVKMVCPNCGQWRHNGDCLNRCAANGFAPVQGPDTLNF